MPLDPKVSQLLFLSLFLFATRALANEVLPFNGTGKYQLFRQGVSDAVSRLPDSVDKVPEFPPSSEKWERQGQGSSETMRWKAGSWFLTISVKRIVVVTRITMKGDFDQLLTLEFKNDGKFSFVSYEIVGFDGILDVNDHPRAKSRSRGGMIRVDR